MNPNRRGALVVVLGTFLCCAPWIPQGLDFSDDGHNLTNQIQLQESGGIPLTTRASLVWFSDLAGAGWARLSDRWGLMGVRIGWLFLMLATAWLAYRLLARRFPPMPAAVTVIGTSLIVQTDGRMLIDYNHVPYFLVLIALSTLTAAADVDRLPRQRLKLYAATGAMLALATLSKLTAAPALLLAAAVPGIRWLARGKLDRMELRGLLATAAGSLTTLAAVALWLGSAGQFGNVLRLLRAAEVSDSHDPTPLIENTLRSAAWIAPVTFIGVGAGFCIWRALLRIMRSRRPVRFFSYALLAFAAVFVISVPWIGPTLFQKRLDRIFVYGAIGLCGVTCARALWKLRHEQDTGLQPKVELAVLAMAAAVFICLGSDSGLFKMKNGLWLVLPCSLLILREWTLDRSNEVPGGGLSPETRDAVIWTLFAVLMAGAAGFRAGYPYRDMPDRLRLTAAVHHPRLRGIRTTRERAASVQALLTELRPRVVEGESVLAYPSIPMVYYLTGTRPALKHALPVSLPVPDLTERLAAAASAGRLPRIAVRARVDTTSPFWPARTQGPAPSPQVRLLDRWLRDQGFETAWSSRQFSILARNVRRTRPGAPIPADRLGAGKTGPLRDGSY